MDVLHQLEIALTLWFQSLGAWLLQPMKAFSTLGTEEFFIMAMPALYWCLDGVLGFRVAIMLLLSNGLNTIFKMSFLSPRPYWFDNRVQGLASETSFGVPSNHAQGAASIWGMVAVSSKSKGVRAILILIILMIGLSRVYMGVHFLSDVVIGWLIGAVLLWAYLKVEPPIRAWLKKLSFGQMLGLALGTSLVLMLSIVLTASAHQNWQVPGAWLETIQVTLPGSTIDPFLINNAFTLAGTWLGMLSGAAWFYHRTGQLFNASGTPAQRLLRYVVGLVGILILWNGLGRIFPREADLLSYSLRYLRYILVGLWISAAAPLLFERMGLAGATRKQIPSLSSEENPL